MKGEGGYEGGPGGGGIGQWYKGHSLSKQWPKYLNTSNTFSPATHDPADLFECATFLEDFLEDLTFWMCFSSLQLQVHTRRSRTGSVWTVIGGL